MDIEMNEEQLAANSINVEQPIKQNELTGGTNTEQSACHKLGDNLYSGVSNMTITQLQQQRQQDVAINIDACFDSNCAHLLSDAEIVDNIIKASKRTDCNHWMYLFLSCIPVLIITIVVWIIWSNIACSSKPDDRCTIATGLCVTGIIMSCFTILIFFLALCYGARNYRNANRYDMLNRNVRCVVKLEGDQWTRYVNYMYGPDRADLTYLGAVGDMTFCCCRKPQYKKLIARGYGYIVFCQQGFLLDEMYHIVRNQPHIVLAVKYIIGTGLRVYLLRSDSKYVVKRHWSEERCQQAGMEAFHRQTVPLYIYLPTTTSENTLFQLALQVQHGL